MVLPRQLLIRLLDFEQRPRFGNAQKIVEAHLRQSRSFGDESVLVDCGLGFEGGDTGTDWGYGFAEKVVVDVEGDANGGWWCGEKMGLWWC